MSLKDIPQPALMEIVVELYLRGFEAAALSVCSGLKEKEKMDVKTIQVSHGEGGGSEGSSQWQDAAYTQVLPSRFKGTCTLHEYFHSIVLHSSSSERQIMYF